MTNNNITVIGADKFSFARGFKMPNDEQVADGSKDWVNWGKDNLFPNFLNNILYSSAYQSGIIRGKLTYLIGSGYQVSEGDEESLKGIFGDYSAQDVLEAIFFDYEMYDGFAVRVMRSLDGSKTYEHIDFDSLRASKEGSGWWYSDDWSIGTQDPIKTGLKFYPKYEKNGDDFDSIYVYTSKTKSKIIKKNTKDLLNVYPNPVWIGALKSLMTDVEIQSFHLHNIINGMKVSGVLNFANGDPENKSKFEAQVQDAITPTENAGGILINYSDGDDRKPSFIPFSGDDLDKRYLMLEKSMVQNIMTAHCVISPALFGIKTEGGWGSDTELEVAFEIFKKTYIRGRQKVVEEHFNYLMDGVTIEINETESLFGEESPDEAGQETNDEIITDSPEEAKTDSVQDTALNGAQISSLISIVESVANSILSPDSAVEVILASFPLISRPQAQRIVSGDASVFSKFNEENTIEDTVISELAKCGKTRNNFKVLRSNVVDEDFDFDRSAKKLKDEFFLSKFAISDLDSRVLDLVRKGESLDSIVNALEDDSETIQRSYNSMVKDGLITDGDISEQGIRELAQNQPDFEVEILYSYEKRPDVSGSSILPNDRTRDFCATLINLNRLYTRQEIENISGVVNRNVWLYRGGWYSDPNKDRPTPFCRHIWKQNLTINRG